MVKYPLVGTASEVHRRRNADQGMGEGGLSDGQVSPGRHCVGGSSPTQRRPGDTKTSAKPVLTISHFSPIGDLLRNYKKIPFQAKQYAGQNWGRGLFMRSS